jgi:hypothetical protein
VPLSTQIEDHAEQEAQGLPVYLEQQGIVDLEGHRLTSHQEVGSLAPEPLGRGLSPSR